MDGDRADDAPSPAGSALSAKVYAIALATVAAAAAASPLAHVDGRLDEWLAFVVLAACTAVAELFVVATSREQAFPASVVFVLAAALLMRPGLAVIVVLARFVSRRLRTGRSDTLLATDVSTCVLAVLSAWAASSAALDAGRGALGSRAAWGLAGLAACVAFVVVTHALLAVKSRLADGRRIQESDALSVESLLADVAVAALGVVLAGSWRWNPWLLPFALAPLVLAYRSLHVPKLLEQARVDPKTGLFNARHFAVVLDEELARARRLDRPLAVIMADLDLLRDINNAHGHLVGDAVLAGVANVFRGQLRPYDTPARFGGEEFAILLPETTCEQALEVAERIRRAVAGTAFDVAAAGGALRVTVSLGVAAYPDDGTRPNELVHRADLAVYRAKLQGRNRVVAASAVPFLSAVAAPHLVETAERADVAPPAAQRHTRLRLPLLGSPTRVGPALVAATPALAAGAILIGIAGGAHPILLAFLAASLLFLLRPSRPAVASRESERRATELWRAAKAIHERTLSAERANKLLRESSAATLETFSAAIDARDKHTAGHSRRVQRLAVSIGRELGLSDAELEVLERAAIFHDIGKLGVPDAVLLKPAELTDEEWELMRRHPVEGALLIERLGFLADALPAIKHHHERYDGSGYPDHLSGEEIPLGARIIHVADALDAMLTPRVYRPALSASEALDELRRGAGAQFCPRCVEALDRVMLAELKDGGHVPYSLLAS